MSFDSLGNPLGSDNRPIGTTRKDKQNVYTYRMQHDSRYKYGLFVLAVNGKDVAHGPKGKINALMRLLNDSEIDVPEAEAKPIGTTETAQFIDYNDWDTLVHETYGNRKYECVAAEEWNNYESHDFNYTKKKEISNYQARDLAAFKAGEWVSGITHTLFQDMVNNNVLPPGKYVIKVSW